MFRAGRRRRRADRRHCRVVRPAPADRPVAFAGTFKPGRRGTSYFRSVCVWQAWTYIRENGMSRRSRLPGHRNHRLVEQEHRRCDPDRRRPRFENPAPPALVRGGPDPRPSRRGQDPALSGDAEDRLHDRRRQRRRRPNPMARAYLAVRAEVPGGRARPLRPLVRNRPPALGVARLRGAPRLALLEPQRSRRCMSRFTSSTRSRRPRRRPLPKRSQPLVADFDRVWGDRVTRRRAILDVVQEIGP